MSTEYRRVRRRARYWAGAAGGTIAVLVFGSPHLPVWANVMVSITFVVSVACLHYYGELMTVYERRGVHHEDEGKVDRE